MVSKRHKSLRFLCALLAIVFSLSLSTIALATDSRTASVEDVTDSVASVSQTYGTLSGYGQGTVTKNSGAVTFDVPVSGNYSTAAGMTIKTSGNADAFGYITVYKPNGSVYKNQLYFTGQQEKKYQLYFVNGGTYKVKVDFYVPSGSVKTECWIYA